MLTAFASVGLIVFALKRGSRFGMALAITVTAIVAVVAWVVLVATTQAIAFRTAYAALLALYAGVGALSFFGTRRSLAGVLIPIAIVNAWFLVSLATLSGVEAMITF